MVIALAGSAAQVDSTIALIGIPVATLTVQIDVLGRFINTYFQHRADKYAAVGNSKQVEISNTLGVLCWALSRMIPVFIALVVGPSLVDKINAIMPAWLSDGLSIAAALFPAIGFSILLKYLPVKQNFQYLIIGFILVACFSASTIAVACIGIALALIVYQNEGRAAAVAAAGNPSVIEAEEEDYDE